MIKQRWGLVLHVGVLMAAFICSNEVFSQNSRTAIPTTSMNRSSSLPEPLTNAAISGYNKDNEAYIYTFGGLDSTLKWSGIHRRCYRINAQDSSEVLRLPDLPDTLGKIAASATRIGTKSYIIGGYHVYADGSEKSSKLVHEFDLLGDTFTTKIIELPLPIDDQVQASWNDSLIFIINGWYDSTNVRYTQIYNPKENSWKIGTPMPLNMIPAFGATGTIIRNTIYVQGGARSDRNFFPAMNLYYTGEINPNNPTDIAWTAHGTADTNSTYRSAIYALGESRYAPLVIGGSKRSYNYNGVDYQLNTLVEPLDKKLELGKNGYSLSNFNNLFGEELEIPMDIRDWTNLNMEGLINVPLGPNAGDTANIYSFSAMYIVGGITKEGKVSNGIIQILNGLLGNVSDQINSELFLQIFPNPANSTFHIRMNDQKTHSLKILEVRGNQVLSKQISTEETVDISELKAGVYFVVIDDMISKKLIKK